MTSSNDLREQLIVTHVLNDFPLVSVVIPTYNRENTILRAVQSVQNQTYQNYEIIVVDDGSTDNTKAVLSEIISQRVNYVYQVNSGASKARNTGIEHAKGEYIAFLDSDDLFLPHHLSVALPVLLSGDYICTYSQVIVNRGDDITYLKPNRPYSIDENISEYYLCDRGWIPTQTLIVPIKLTKLVRFNEKLRAGNDADFAIRLVHSGGKLLFIDRPSTIFNDKADTGRISKLDNLEERLMWLENSKHIITKRAYFGEKGWKIAKLYAQRGQITKALYLYLSAVFRRCYKPKLALPIFLQIMLGPNNYRKIANIIAKTGIKP